MTSLTVKTRPTTVLSGSSLGDGQAKSPEQVFISHSTLRGLLQRYRHGRIFVSSEDCSIARRKEKDSEDAAEQICCNASEMPRSQRAREELGSPAPCCLSWGPDYSILHSLESAKGPVVCRKPCMDH